jgi:hypothetical protein
MSTIIQFEESCQWAKRWRGMAKKCKFHASEVTYLGLIVSRDGMYWFCESLSTIHMKLTRQTMPRECSLSMIRTDKYDGLNTCRGLTLML